MLRRAVRALCLCTALGVYLAPESGAAPSIISESLPAPVVAKPITSFKAGSDQTRFGAFEFVGGLQLTSSEPLFGAWSSFRLRADGVHFVGVADTGHWLTGRLVRDAVGRLSGLAEVSITPMRDARGEEPRVKGDSDAEGLALRRGQAIVSFERRHRVDVYPDPGFEHARPERSLDILIPKRELRSNGSLETVLVAPLESALKGAVITIAEQSVDADGNLYAAILEGPLKGQFKVVRNDPFDVTDGAFLPNGDLLLLERRFSILGGVGMRIRRIAGKSLKPGALVDGPVLLEADMGFEIDNMEGIDVVAGPDGHAHVILVSDDNHSILQRNLMLEFRLVE
ncbi:hypothetical protein J2858_003173 [Neorhizobium galegae]|uniref:esterase-like activity of phytase family protein n=1 Tax=Neorhizobium galegae TaxID=399 RepID=UPI001AE3AFFB|nr:esterase-like activity of phytase family protein [Neorhizobium galegae]MBP2550237.1 hypothetical protein [Neorhizobium galegae]